jgi:hypothetical protein
VTTFDVDVRPYRWMILDLLWLHMTSSPNLNPIILWIGFALVIGALSAQAERLAPGATPDSQHAARGVCP